MESVGIPEDLRSAYLGFATALGDYSTIAAQGAAAKDMAKDDPKRFATFQTAYELARDGYDEGMRKFAEALSKYMLRIQP